MQTFYRAVLSMLVTLVLVILTEYLFMRKGDKD